MTRGQGNLLTEIWKETDTLISKDDATKLEKYQMRKGNVQIIHDRQQKTVLKKNILSNRD